MSLSVQTRRGKHQLRVKHRLLPEPFFHTFDDEDGARKYGRQLHDLLDRGIVPQELMKARRLDENPLIEGLIDEYQLTQPVAPSDEETLATVRSEVPGVRVGSATFAWAESYVKGLKVNRNLAPGTIRKRIGALARVLDWYLVRAAEKTPDKVRVNPLRLLKQGYSQYSKVDEKAVRAAGGEAKEDVTRDRRLTPEEERRIRLTFAGTKRGDRERPLAKDPELEMLFDLILDTGMRLREAYRLRVDQVDLAKGVVNVEGTNKRGGARLLRVVPLKPVLRERLKKYSKRREGLLFSFWSGVEEDLSKASTKLSSRFKTLFEYAAVEDFTEHDLRHEATCRWFELKTPKGAWVFSDLEICKIMGWTSTKMALRYLSLRGEDLASRLL